MLEDDEAVPQTAAQRPPHHVKAQNSLSGMGRRI
jgi:hypothetical protein